GCLPLSSPKAMQTGRGKGLGDQPFACAGLSQRFIYTIFPFDFCVFYGSRSTCYIPALTVRYTQQKQRRSRTCRIGEAGRREERRFIKAQNLTGASILRE